MLLPCGCCYKTLIATLLQKKKKKKKNNKTKTTAKQVNFSILGKVNVHKKDLISLRPTCRYQLRFSYLFRLIRHLKERKNLEVILQTYGHKTTLPLLY